MFQGEVLGFIGMSYLLAGFCVLLVTLFIFLHVFWKVKNRGTDSEAGSASRKNKIEEVCQFQEQSLVSICATSWEENYRHQLIEALLRDHRNTTV